MYDRETERQRQARHTKRKLYTSARKLISEKGYENVQINEICTDAGVSPGLFYHYFPNLSHVYVEGNRLFNRQVEKYVQQHASLPCRERLKSLIEMYLNEVIQSGVLYTAYYISAQLRDDTVASCEPFVQLNSATESILSEMIDQKILRGDAHEIRIYLLCFINGLLRDWCIAQGKFDLIAQGMHVLDIIFTYYAY